MRTSRPQRMIVAGVLASPLFGTAACGAGTESTASAAATSSVSATGTTSATAGTTESPTLESLVVEVAGQFQQLTYTDPETGTTMSYNLYLPEDYDPSQTYPLVTYIADSSQVGEDTTIPLSQYRR